MCMCVWMSECVCMASVYISYIGKVNIIKEEKGNTSETGSLLQTQI